MMDRATCDQDLRTPAQNLKGIGPQRAELLAKLGLHTALDILFFFPRTYQDLTELSEIRELEEGPIHRVLATVEEVELRDSGAGRSTVGVLLRQDHDTCGPYGSTNRSWHNSSGGGNAWC